MRGIINSVLLTAPLVAVLMAAEKLPAQTNGTNNGTRIRGGDPAQFLERRMERYRERLEVPSDEEWRVIQARIEKIMQAQRELRGGALGGPRRGPTPNSNQSGESPNAARRGVRGTRFTAEPNPEAEALQKLVDSKAPAAEIKSQLARLREAHKQKEATLVSAQEELRQVLTARQEAIAVLEGLLR